MAAPIVFSQVLLLRIRADASLNRVVRSGYCERSTNMQLQVDLKLSAATVGAKFPSIQCLPLIPHRRKPVRETSTFTCSNCLRSTQEVRLDRRMLVRNLKANGLPGY
jgi:hypothetical protein